MGEKAERRIPIGKYQEYDLKIISGKDMLVANNVLSPFKYN